MEEFLIDDIQTGQVTICGISVQFFRDKDGNLWLGEKSLLPALGLHVATFGVARSRKFEMRDWVDRNRAIVENPERDELNRVTYKYYCSERIVYKWVFDRTAKLTSESENWSPSQIMASARDRNVSSKVSKKTQQAFHKDMCAFHEAHAEIIKRPSGRKVSFNLE